MSAQDVYKGGQWRHLRAGFNPIGVHEHAVAFSAALETEGLTDAPADNQRVAELYQKTVGVHLAAQLAAKKLPGLTFKAAGDMQQGKHEWSHGKCIVMTETAARTFSEALQRRELLKAPIGDPRVQSTARKSKFHVSRRRPRAPNSFVCFHRSRKRTTRSSSRPPSPIRHMMA